MISTIPLADGPRSPRLDRAIAFAIAAVAIAVTAALSSVEPDPRGHGTHEALGLSPCSWPRTYGGPCPTCGATTAACLLVHGRPFAALATQPFGAAIAGFGLWLGVVAIYCLVRGRSFLDVYVQLPRTKILLAFVVLLLASWAYTWCTFVPS